MPKVTTTAVTLIVIVMICIKLPSIFHLNLLHQVTLGVGRITILKAKTACPHITNKAFIDIRLRPGIATPLVAKRDIIHKTGST